jgi:serine/threonine protein kinase
MATVYRAEHERLRKTVALKVMDPVVAEDEEYRERFLREARAAAKLNHQNLVRALDAGFIGGFYFISMELVEGVDLRKRIEDGGPLPEKEALSVGISVCHALDEASRNGIVHRDVKPENILLARDGVVKLTDLGLAKVRGEDVTLTKKGLTVGTVAYFAPEQALGEPDLDVRTDLYALGATLYAAVSGELPFGRGENVPETMQRILTEAPPALQEIAPKVSAPVRHAIERFMEKDRKKRPQNAREAIRLLEGVLRGESTGSTSGRRVDSARASARKSMRRSGRRRSTTGLGFVVALVAALAFVAVIFLSHHDGNASPETTPPAPPATPPAAPLVKAPALPPLAAPVTPPAPPARALHARVEALPGGASAFIYDAFAPDVLDDFDTSGKEPKLVNAALEWQLGADDKATLRHRVEFAAPVSVALDVEVVSEEDGARADVVFLDTDGRRTAGEPIAGTGRQHVEVSLGDRAPGSFVLELAGSQKLRVSSMKIQGKVDRK